MINFIKTVYAIADEGANSNPVSAKNLPTYAGTGFKFGDASIGYIIGSLLPYIYVAAGLVLLLMLILGGIGLMTSAGNPDKSKAAFGRISGALIGFLIIFISYMVALIVEKLLGVKFM